jgi:hypothetical protein
MFGMLLLVRDRFIKDISSHIYLGMIIGYNNLNLFNYYYKYSVKIILLFDILNMIIINLN